MNRIIKFRAWDKDLRKMYSRWTVIPDDDRSHILMQFTGLFDKHDKEIYEGDILKTRYGRRVVEYDETHAGFFPFGGHFNIVWGDKTEVIGNKFENPELIK